MGPKTSKPVNPTLNLTPTPQARKKPGSPHRNLENPQKPPRPVTNSNQVRGNVLANPPQTQTSKNVRERLQNKNPSTMTLKSEPIHSDPNVRNPYPSIAPLPRSQSDPIVNPSQNKVVNPGDPGGGGGKPKPTREEVKASQQKIQQTQKDIEEVTILMKVNVEKLMERDEKLFELDDRAEALEQSSKIFKKNTVKLKGKYWWKNKMLCIGLIVLIVFFIAIILISLVVSFGSSKSEKMFVAEKGPGPASKNDPHKLEHKYTLYLV